MKHLTTFNEMVDEFAKAIDLELEEFARGNAPYLIDNGFDIYCRCVRHGNTTNSTTFISYYRYDKKQFKWGDIMDDFITLFIYLSKFYTITGVYTLNVLNGGFGREDYSIDDIMNNTIDENTIMTNIYINLDVNLKFNSKIKDYR